MKRVAWLVAPGACAIAGLALALTGLPAQQQASGTSGLVGQAVTAQAAAALPANPARLRDAQLAALGSTPRDGMTTRDGSGWLRSYNRSGAIDTGNAFFQRLGSNGRSCDSCHRLEAGWSITPTELRARFNATDGTDPIFRRNDGSNSPNADVSTVAARRQAYSMLLGHGVIRVGLPIPANAEFVLADVDDPYGFASAAELSLFRRPLPSTNLSFLTGVMWDVRETATPFLPPMHAGQDHSALVNSLIHQVLSATKGHAEGLDPTDAQMAAIVVFETGLTTAQIRDDVAGYLNADDAIGGPRILAQQRFHIGINDTLGNDPTGASFEPESMSLFGAWADQEGNGKLESARLSIARGERLFNEKPINISGVGGLNDALAVANIAGTCTTCHNSPNVGNHSVALPLNIGLADASRRTADMPLYTLRNKTSNAIVRTTDPGLALLTGKWKDIGRFKGPILRGLAARPPYFHNGFAASLDEVVEFYDTRFDMKLTRREKDDLAAFLRSL
ncbi:hypothetical protein BH11PSE14_BH11PSE14_21330 [soil metagenome]